MFDPNSPFPSFGHGQSTHDALRPLPKATLALARLREAILGCELAPGEKINEQATAERFGLGRAAMRSALARLEGMGLVEAMPRSGWQVRPLSPQHIRDLIEARRRLEPSLLARALAPAQIDAIDQQATVIAALLGQDGASARLTGRANDRQFLDVLAQHANRWTMAWLRDAWDECARVTTFLEAGSPARLPLADRRPLVAALRRGDRAAAERALIAPIDDFADFAAAGLMSLEIELSAPSGRRAKVSLPKPPLTPMTAQETEEGAPATSHRELKHEDPT